MTYYHWIIDRVDAFYARLFATVHRRIDGKHAERTTVDGRDAAFAGSGMSWEPITLGICCAPRGSSMLGTDNSIAALASLGMIGNNAWQNAYAQQQMDQQSRYQNALVRGIASFAQ